MLANPTSNIRFLEYIKEPTVSMIDCLIRSARAIASIAFFIKCNLMKLALVLVIIIGLTSLSLPTSAKWVFNTGESVTYPRSQSVGRSPGNQTTRITSSPYVDDMIHKTMLVQTLNEARISQQR
jgi:hypothetical protein